MSSRNPTGWMWAQACDLLDQAEHMHRQFFRLAASARTQVVWEPPADVFEDESDVVIVVALPGVAPERIDVKIGQGVLIVRAERVVPFAGTPRVVRRLEIPYGRFERRIALPHAGVEPAGHEFVNGCLVVMLRKTGQ
jgi:HSP20 family protein